MTRHVESISVSNNASPVKYGMIIQFLIIAPVSLSVPTCTTLLCYCSLQEIFLYCPVQVSQRYVCIVEFQVSVAGVARALWSTFPPRNPRSGINGIQIPRSVDWRLRIRRCRHRRRWNRTPSTWLTGPAARCSCAGFRQSPPSAERSPVVGMLVAEKSVHTSATQSPANWVIDQIASSLLSCRLSSCLVSL